MLEIVLDYHLRGSESESRMEKSTFLTDFECLKGIDHNSTSLLPASYKSTATKISSNWGLAEEIKNELDDCVCSDMVTVVIRLSIHKNVKKLYNMFGFTGDFLQAFSSRLTAHERVC